MRSIWYIILLLVLLGSCRKAGTQQREMVAELTGKEIVFPSELIYQIQDNEIEYDPTAADYTIITYIDSSGCIPCNLRLGAWDRLINELKTRAEDTRVNFVMILNTGNEESRYALKRDNFNHPVSFDPEGRFNIANSLGDEPNYHTFLLDREGKIKVVGNPVVNPKVRELYRKVIAPDGSVGNGLCPYPSAAIGAVYTGDSIVREFIFHNETAKKITIEDIVPSCYCTTGLIDRDTIDASSTAVLTVKYVADSIIGPVTSYIDVFYKEKEDPERITLHGYVINKSS